MAVLALRSAAAVATLLLTACGGASTPEAAPVTTAPATPAAPSPTPAALVDTFPAVEIAFANATEGLAINGAAVVRSSDGGRTWQVADTATGPLRDLRWIDASHALVAGGPGLLGTADAGATWRLIHPGPRPGGYVRLSVLDAHDVAAISLDGELWRIDLDDGAPVHLPPPFVSGVSALSFVDSRHGWVIGTQGIASTTDGGSTWRIQTSPVLSGLASLESRMQIHFADRTHGYALLPYGCAAGTCFAGLMATDDGGHTWSYRSAATVSGMPTPLYQSLPADIADILPTGPQSLLAAEDSNGNVPALGAGTSPDGGRSWACRSGHVPDPPIGAAIATPTRGRLQVAFLMSAVATGPTLAIAGSTDGGSTWIIEATFPST